MSIDNGNPAGISPQEASNTNPLIVEPPRYNRMLYLDQTARERRARRRLQGTQVIDSPTTIELASSGSAVTFIPSRQPGRGVFLTDREIRPATARNSLGRHPQHSIQFRDTTVSASHARLDQWHGWKLTDTNSTNGTYLEPVRSLSHLPTHNGRTALPVGEWAMSPLDHPLTVQVEHTLVNFQISREPNGQHYVRMDGASWQPLTEGAVVTVGSNQDSDPTRQTRDTLNLPKHKFPGGGHISVALYEGQVYMGNFSQNSVSVENPTANPHRADTIVMGHDPHRADTLPLQVQPDTHHAGSTPHHRGRRLGIHFPDLSRIWGGGQQESPEQREAPVQTYDIAGRTIGKNPDQPDLNQDGMVMLQRGGFTAVIDGMGGVKNAAGQGGRDAMRVLQPIIAQEMHAVNAGATVTEDAVEEAYRRIMQKGRAAMPAQIGAVIAMAQPVGETLVCGTAGDAEVGILNIQTGQIRYVTPREGLPHGQVSNAVSAHKGEIRITKEAFRAGDKFVVVISDGPKKKNYAEVEQRIKDCAQHRYSAKSTVDNVMGFYQGQANPDDVTISIVDLESAR